MQNSFGQTSITSVSVCHSMSDYYFKLIILFLAWIINYICQLSSNYYLRKTYQHPNVQWSLTYNFILKISILKNSPTYFSFIFKFRKLKLSTVIHFLIWQKITTRRWVRLNLVIKYAISQCILQVTKTVLFLALKKNLSANVKIFS